MNYQIFLQVAFVSIFLFTLSLSPVLAAPTVMTAEAKMVLITKLLNQLSLLQAELAALKAAEAKIKPKNYPIPATAADYTYGSSNAPINIITYTDYECPFCKLFHETLRTVLTQYSNIAVTYRPFPLEQLHPNAMELSLAAECVGRLGGDTAYLAFVDTLFNSREVNEKTDMKKLPSYITSAGVSLTRYTSCRKSADIKNTVNAVVVEGLKSGVTGTPKSYIFKNGVGVGLIDGAQPLSAVQNLLDITQRY